MIPKPTGRLPVTRGNLASIKDEAEKNFLAKFAGSDAWIGGAKLADGTWIWLDGSALDYTNWNRGEPNNQNGKEDSTMLHWDGTGVWNDAAFGHLLGGYVCQYLDLNQF